MTRNNDQTETERRRNKILTKREGHWAELWLLLLAVGAVPLLLLLLWLPPLSGEGVGHIVHL